MAILTTSGRAALAAAIKQQTMHLALGEGDDLWNTTKEVSLTFDSSGVLDTGQPHISAVEVKSTVGNTLYLLDTDYSVNAREGTLRRLPNGAISGGATMRLKFKIDVPPETISQAALLGEVGRRVVDEVHFVAAHAEGEIVVPTGRYRISATPTNHLFVRVRFDFDDVATSVIREQGLFVGTQTDTTLPPGQKFFLPAQVSEPGILLVLQNSVPIVRQPSTRETFEFVVTF
jgi:hypothetical protein